MQSYNLVCRDFGGSVVKGLPANEGDVGLIPGSGRSPGGGNGNLFQYSCLDNSMDVSLAAYSPWGHKELDMTEQLNHHCCPEVELGGCYQG